MPATTISVVAPCFNEAESIAEFYRRTVAVFDALPEYALHLIVVDDGSTDASLAILKQLAATDSRLTVVELSRNFGQEIPLSAGLDFVTGDAVVIIDSDLQDPPEMIPQFIAKWREGFDVVYGIRPEREGESWLKRSTARWYYRMLGKLAEVPIPLDTGNFRIMSAAVVKALRSMPERDRYFRGMVSWVGFRQIGIEYVRNERFAGKSKFSPSQLLALGADGIVSFSRKPLWVTFVVGLTAALFSIAGILWVLGLRLFTNAWVEGWAATFIAILFMGGLQLMALGVLGLYLGRVFTESKQRPLYFVRSVTNPQSGDAR